MALSLDQKSPRLGPRGAQAPADWGAGDLRRLLARAEAAAAEAERRLAEQGRRIAELEALALTDAATGLFNARGFRTMFERALRAAARDGHRGVLGYLDLDGFKAVNDRFGHGAGDAALRHVARLLQSGIRPDDVAARLGGDEFAVLFVRTAPADGTRRLDAIGRAMESAPLRIGLHRVRLRASIGAAPYDGGSDPEAVIAAADRAMYRRKRAERGDGLALVPAPTAA